MNTDILKENLLILLGEKRSLRIEHFAQYFNHLKYDIDPEDDAKEEDVTDEVREVSYLLPLFEKQKTFDNVKVVRFHLWNTYQKCCCLFITNFFVIILPDKY